jgi:PAS domain S-box-containing protein
MRRIGNIRIIIFFTVLTFLLTVSVVYAWERALMSPLYRYYERHYPGAENADYRWRMAQRIEHFFISVTVDVIVVSLLLRLINNQQRKLLLSEERYRSLFEQAADGIAVVRAMDHQIVEVNHKLIEMLGQQASWMIGKHVCDVLRCYGGSGSAESKGVFELIGSGDKEPGFMVWTGERELTLQLSGGGPLPVSVSCGELTTGRETLLILIIRDLTLRKRLEGEKQDIEQQLFQSARLASLGELSAGVAHEINNPLNCIVNFAQLLKEDGVARNEIEGKMLQGIIDEGDRIAEIVRNLLTFARQTTDTTSQVCLLNVIDNSMSLFGHQLSKEGIRVEIDLPQAVSPVMADPSRLRQVVVNMVSNARYALKDRSCEARVIRISARDVEKDGRRFVRLEFFDNGAGIRRDIIDKVFDPFFTTRRDSGGTGLGLSLSFGIIRDYGGTITVESEEGSYTKFIVLLPTARSLEPEYAENLAGR